MGLSYLNHEAFLWSSFHHFVGLVHLPFAISGGRVWRFNYKLSQNHNKDDPMKKICKMKFSPNVLFIWCKLLKHYFPILYYLLQYFCFFIDCIWILYVYLPLLPSKTHASLFSKLWLSLLQISPFYCESGPPNSIFWITL